VASANLHVCKHQSFAKPCRRVVRTRIAMQVLDLTRLARHNLSVDIRNNTRRIVLANGCHNRSEWVTASSRGQTFSDGRAGNLIATSSINVMRSAQYQRHDNYTADSNFASSRRRNISGASSRSSRIHSEQAVGRMLRSSGPIVHISPFQYYLPYVMQLQNCRSRCFMLHMEQGGLHRG
jgi:hypothetical protein